VKHIPAATALSVLFCLFPFACEDNAARSVVDAGVDAEPVEAAPETSTPDAESLDSAMADACVLDAPADAQSCTGQLCGFVPPPFHPLAIQACTAPQIEAYLIACGLSNEDYTPACLAWKADPANANCKSCVLRTDHSGPILFYNDGTTTANPNEGACIALSGAPDCGAADDASYSCLVAACGSCPLDGGAFTGNCYEVASAGACATYGDTYGTCVSTLTGPAVDCVITMPPWTPQMRKAITVLCGIPDDGGGPSDSGPDGGSEAGTQEGGASEAGASDGAPD
jgi:hypothetical protein